MLRERFTDQMKAAMKSGEKTRLGTIRMVQAALKDRDIEARGAGREPLTDDEILGLLQKLVKQRQESVALYEGAGRQELAAQEREEIAVIAEFMPRPLGEAETIAAVAAAIDQTGAASIKDMGRVIAKLRAEFAGRMDFGKVSGLVKDALAKG